MSVPDDLTALALAQELAKANGYVSINAPNKSTRTWYIRMARAVIADRERSINEVETLLANVLGETVADGVMGYVASVIRDEAKVEAA